MSPTCGPTPSDDLTCHRGVIGASLPGCNREVMTLLDRLAAHALARLGPMLRGDSCALAELTPSRADISHAFHPTAATVVSAWLAAHSLPRRHQSSDPARRVVAHVTIPEALAASAGPSRWFSRGFRRCADRLRPRVPWVALEVETVAARRVQYEAFALVPGGRFVWFPTPGRYFATPLMPSPFAED